MEKILEALKQLQTNMEKQQAEAKATSEADRKELREAIDEVKARITTVEEKTAVGRHFAGAEQEADKFSFARFLAAVATKDWSNAGFEKSVVDEAARVRAPLTTEGDSLGGYIVPNQFMSDIIELKRNATVLRAAGATFMDDLMGSPVEIPKQTAAATINWVAENDAATESNPTLGMIKMRPHQAIGAVRVSNRFLRMGAGAEQFVRNDLAEGMARLTDLAGMRGTGANGQPLGVINTPDITTLNASAGADFDVDAAIDAMAELDASNTVRNTIAWIMHSRVWNKMRKQRTDSGAGAGTGPYFFSPDVADFQRNTLLGYPVLTTNAVPTDLTDGTLTTLSDVLVANWSDLILAEWDGTTFAASSEAEDVFLKNQSLIRVTIDADVGVRHGDSFVRYDKVKTV